MARPSSGPGGSSYHHYLEAGSSSLVRPGRTRKYRKSSCTGLPHQGLGPPPASKHAGGAARPGSEGLSAAH